MVAAPLWAFAHMDTEGEGVGQRAQTGYLFILNVLFRPTLMVVGFVLGAMMCSLLTNYVLALYPTIIANCSVDSWTGLIKICAYFSAFVIILQMVVNVSFQAIRYVPDQVLGWVGGNMQNSVGASESNQVGDAAKSAIVMRGSMSGQGMMAKAKQAKLQEDQSKAAGQASSARHGQMMDALNGGGKAPANTSGAQGKTADAGSIKTF